MKKLLLLLFFMPTVVFAKPIVHIQHWETSNHVPVYYVQSTTNPIVDVAVIFHAGSAYDGKHYGLANLANNMLGEATSKYNADEISDLLAATGAHFNNQVSRGMAVLSFRSLTEKTKLNKTISLFSDIIENARFPSDNFKRIQHQTLMALQGQAQDASTIATNEMMHRVFGNTPFGHNVLGTMKTVSAISDSDVEDFYKQYYVARNAFVVIVGDVDEAQAKAIANKIMDKLPKGKHAGNPAIHDKTVGGSMHIEFPSTQNHIRMGQITIDRSSPDYFALKVGNFILGNGFTSRLYKQVRQKYGLSYTVGSQLITLPTNSLFFISLQTQNSTSHKAITVAKQTIQHFIASGPTKTELEQAKASINGAFPLGFDSNTDIVTQVATLVYYNLPLNYYDSYRDKINAVTATQIKNAFSKYINIKHMAVISVGGK